MTPGFCRGLVFCVVCDDRWHMVPQCSARTPHYCAPVNERKRRLHSQLIDATGHSRKGQSKTLVEIIFIRNEVTNMYNNHNNMYLVCFGFMVVCILKYYIRCGLCR